MFDSEAFDTAAFSDAAFNFDGAVSSVATTVGGWFAFLNTYEHRLANRRDEERRRQEAEADEIEDKLDRQIAELLRKQEAQDAKRAELEQVAALARQNADLESARQYSERVGRAYQAVLEKGSASAVERLERELKRAKDEEEFLMLVIMLHESL